MSDKNNKEKSRVFISSRDVKDYPIVVPSEKLPPKLERIAKQLESRVIGQSRAIRKALRSVSTYEAGLNDPKRPPGGGLLAGPSGSGKTYFAKEFAYAWIGPPKNGREPFVLIPCGSLNERHEKSLLTGSPPGYIGFDKPSVLEQINEYDGIDIEKEITVWYDRNDSVFTEFSYTLTQSAWNELVKRLKKKVEEVATSFIENAPPARCVVIFDEIEKAHLTIQQTLLNAHEEGILPLHDPNRPPINFRATMIYYTTNIGTQHVIQKHLRDTSIGFRTGKLPPSFLTEENEEEDSELDQAIYKSVMHEIEDQNQGYFLPEFIGRISKAGITVFRTLRLRHYREILRLMFEEQITKFFLNNDVIEGSMHVAYTKALEDFLISEGVSPLYGARVLRSVLERYVKSELAIPILNQDLVSGDVVLLDVEFERPIPGALKVGKAYIVVRRAERPVGIELQPFQIKDRNKKGNIQKILDDYLEQLWLEYAKSSPYSITDSKKKKDRSDKKKDGSSTKSPDKPPSDTDSQKDKKPKK